MTIHAGAAAIVGILLSIGAVSAAEPTARLALELQDYASLPVTADNTNENTREALRKSDLGDKALVVRPIEADLNVAERMWHATFDLAERSEGRCDPHRSPSG